MLKLFCKQCNQKVDAIPLETPDADFIATCPHCGGRLSPHRVLPPGTVVNGFRIEREIGRGGMGIVYQAKQLDLDRDIALKVLSDEMASDESFIKAFFREARGAAALNHPNIVQAIDAGVAGDIHYFVMELIEGKNLEVYTVRNGALPIPLALKCATSIADALSYAWEFKHLAHRDIKPENIIMKNNSEFKLADLGLVKDCKDTSAEQDENLMATPAYAPPEIIRGEKDVPGFKSDMYSFGATLYQLFAGHAPFVADDPIVVCEMQQDNQPKPLIGLNWNIPQDISILVDKLMEKDPAKRPASWNQVLHDLNRITYNWHMTHNADGTKKKTEPAEPALPTDDQQSLHSHPILLATVVFLAILLIAELILTLCLPEKSGSAEKKVAPIASRQIIAPEQTVLPEPEQPEPEITVQTIAAPEQPPAEPAVEPEPVIKKEETIDDLPDDPDELKNWKRNYKAVLPEEPYARWEMVEEYLEDNLYAPQEARQMLKKLEEGPKKRFQQKLDELLRLTRSSVTYETTVRHGSALLKMAEEAPRWTEGILSADEAKIIRKNVETCRAALDQQAAELKKFREEQQKSLQRQKEQRLLEEAEKELAKLGMDCFYMRPAEFRNTADPFIRKYKDLPEYPELEARLIRFARLREYATASLFPIFEKHEKRFKGKKLFRDLLPDATFLEVRGNSLVFLERKGAMKMPRTLQLTWLHVNQKKILEEMIFGNASLLNKLDPESLAVLFVQAERCRLPVYDYLKRYSGLQPDIKKDLLTLLEEIRRIQNGEK